MNVYVNVPVSECVATLVFVNLCVVSVPVFTNVYCIGMYECLCVFKFTMSTVMQC